MMERSKVRIAVVGTGIAGLATAWLLARRHAVTVFEADARVGGHSHTVMVETGGGPVPVDTGFMVYNEQTYPLLTRLFAHLDVPTQTTTMSFSASIADGSLEYGGGSLKALLAQRTNLLRPAFVRMLLDIVRFNRTGLAYLQQPGDDDLTLGDFLARHGFGRSLGEWYLLPMAAAIWSAPVGRMLEYPARSFLSFFANHGLLSIQGHHVWRTVAGGSREYVRRMVAELGPRICLAMPVRAVRRFPGGVEVTTAPGQTGRFDQVVMACHADQASSLIEDAGPRERELLACFPYQPNRALLHGDPSLMPRRRAVWSSWNYLAQRATAQAARVSVSYWMNSLQSLPCAENVFVSLNPLREPDPRLVHAEIDYAHPVFDRAAVAAQRRMGEIQGAGGIWYAGAWLGHGFHEDGLRAAVAVARGLGVAPPWEAQPGFSGAMGMVEGAAAQPA
jgi:predicted NAD/FAD-binding protein